mgnify:CR=1 FL=1
MDYLVIKCKALSDPYECEYDKTPICCTDDISQYGTGYEIYTINSNGSLSLFKEAEETLSNEMALYCWEKGQNKMTIAPEVISTFKLKRGQITKSFIKKQIKPFFKGTVNKIYDSIESCGSYGEMVDNQWTVFGECHDTHYSLGY